MARAKLPRDMAQAAVCRILERNGLVEKRQATHGTFYVHPDDTDRRALVPKGKVPTGILSAIASSAKKDPEEFARRKARR